MWRYLVASLTHTLPIAAQATGGRPYYTCASQTDFIGNANPFIKGICCRRELAMSVEKHFTHDYITSHTMKSYHHTIVFYIRESYYDAIESNRECFYLGMHNVHAF